MVRLGVGDGLGRDGLLGEKSGLAAPRFFTASSKNNRPGSRASANLASARQGATACEKGASEEMPFVASSVHAIMVVVVMVMMAMGSRPDADVNASAVMVVMVVMVMMVTDHNLGGPRATVLYQTLVVGL